MKNPLKMLARVLLGGIFIGGGINQLKDPTGPAAMTDATKERYGLAGLPDSRQLVLVNGAGMLTAGTALAIGKMPRTSATALAGMLLPTNIVGHAFWEKTNPEEVFIHRNEFFANMAIIGGLIMVVIDRNP